jgi:hypothetical protein
MVCPLDKWEKHSSQSRTTGLGGCHGLPTQCGTGPSRAWGVTADVLCTCQRLWGPSSSVRNGGQAPWA